MTLLICILMPQFVQMVCCILSCEDLIGNVALEIFEAWKNLIKFVRSEQLLQAIAIATLWLKSKGKIGFLNKC
ncbi:hypothetical protein BC830DRAFT_1135372 [Chytriomyces sp. MP71]|nr:hypothetical protein BC830DRAFT_1135372 [Chytriomyces sp. MP71]